MPRVAEGDLKLPPLVADAIDAFRSPLRVAILHYLLSNPDDSTIRGVVDHLNCTRASATRSMHALESLQIIRHDQNSRWFPGQAVEWVVNETRLNKLKTALDIYLDRP